MSGRGEALQIQADRIPFELRAERRWVCWRYEERDGKPTKVPVTPEGAPAKCNDPSTWTTFEACVAAATRNGQIAGIGFVLGNGFVGVDLDHARDPESGRNRRVGRKIIDRLRSYTEISPSGNGHSRHLSRITAARPPAQRPDRDVRRGPVLHGDRRPDQRLRH
jgi:putative DNA primase/helicase